MSDGKQLSPMESFQERLKASLRDDVARMIPDEALAQMIQQVIKDEFFTKKKIPNPNYRGYGYDREPITIEVDTAFQAMVFEAAKPILQRLAKDWVDANQDKLLEHWKKVVDMGLVRYVETLQNEMATRSLRDTLMDTIGKLNEERQKAGLPMLNPIF
jgi:hypothetical protein